jgi:hypothetical protein
MKIKFLLPRRLYFLDLKVEGGWVGIVIENKMHHLVSAGYNFKQTLQILSKWDKE